MASTPFRQASLAANKPPPSWKRSTPYIKVKAETGFFGEEEPQPLSPGHTMSPISKDVPGAPSEEPSSGGVTSLPVSPVADSYVQTASTPRTPRIAPPPPLPLAAPDISTPDRTLDVISRQDSVSTPASSGSHRRTISWGGSPTTAGKVHRRSRSIDSSQDPKEAYRQQLERIGSMDRAPSGGSGSLASTPRVASLGSPTLLPPAQRAVPPLPSPAKQLGQAGDNGLTSAKAPARSSAPKPVKVKAIQSSKEPELISWDEVEQQKDVYQAITTADGRQALVKASSGKDGQEELLFLSDLQSQHSARTNSTDVYSTVFAIPGAVPMMAVPVQYPDGRIMYHVYPAAPQASQVQAPLSPGGSPHVLSPRAQAAAGSSPMYPASPTSIIPSAPAGHQRRVSVSTLSPLQTSSVPYASGLSTVSSTASLSPAGSGQLYALSSGAQSPRLPHTNSGHLFAAALPSSASIRAMSPASSGQLYSVPSAGQATIQAYPAAGVHHATSLPQPSPPQQDLYQKLASMQIGAKAPARVEDPFGGSAVW